MSATPVRRYLAIVRRLHFLTLLATMVPSFCLIATLGMTDEAAAAASSGFVPLYLLTLTLAVPASFQYLIQEKVKNLGIFLLCALPVSFLYLSLLFSFESAAGLSIRGSEQAPQILIAVLYLLDSIRMRTNDNSRKKAKLEEDLSWRGDLYLLPLPSLPLLIPFAILYIGALFLHSHALAQCALLGSILYFFLVLPYHVLSRKEAFLESRHHVSRIPFDQIEQLQLDALSKILLPCALLAAAALLTAGGRHFLDLPTLDLGLSPDPSTAWIYEPSPLLRELWALGYLEQGAYPPQWVLSLIEFVENALTVLMTFVLVWLFWLSVRSLWQRFKKTAGEDSTAAPSKILQDEHISLKRRAHTEEKKRPGSIRRRYRRTILRALGQAPKPFETPSMMEARAGLPDTEQTRTLHEEYERARYGP